MLNLDNVVMSYKLKLREVFKPGDNIADNLELINSDGFKIISKSDNAFKVKYPLYEYEYQTKYMKFKVFDDYGEWELRPININ